MEKISDSQCNKEDCMLSKLSQKPIIPFSWNHTPVTDDTVIVTWSHFSTEFATQITRVMDFVQLNYKQACPV